MKLNKFMVIGIITTGLIGLVGCNSESATSDVGNTPKIEKRVSESVALQKQVTPALKKEFKDPLKNPFFMMYPKDALKLKTLLRPDPDDTNKFVGRYELSLDASKIGLNSICAKGDLVVFRYPSGEFEFKYKKFKDLGRYEVELGLCSWEPGAKNGD